MPCRRCQRGVALVILAESQLYLGSNSGLTHTGAPNQLSDDLKLCVRHQSDATKTRLSLGDRTHLGVIAGSRRAHKCALHFAADRGHRGTLVGELAARKSLRGDVELAHPATYPGFSTPLRLPRACLIFYSRV